MTCIKYNNLKKKLRYRYDLVSAIQGAEVNFIPIFNFC